MVFGGMRASAQNRCFNDSDETDDNHDDVAPQG